MAVRILRTSRTFAVSIERNEKNNVRVPSDIIISEIKVFLSIKKTTQKIIIAKVQKNLREFFIAGLFIG